MAQSYIRDDGVLMVETSPGCFVASKPQQPSRVRVHVATSGQHEAVLDMLRDGIWHTIAEIADALQLTHTGTASRIRDLRTAEHGSHIIERRWLNGAHHYRLVVRFR